MDKPKPKYRAISIDPNTIQVGATAKRNLDGSLHLNNTVYDYDHTPVNLVPTRELPQLLTSNVLKQPHHKLPLKMLLSETARRGGYPNKASLPNSCQIFKPIEELFQRPPESEWKKSRLELLTDPRHLGKKQTQPRRVAKNVQYTNPFNSSGSLYGSSCTPLEENPLPSNEESISFFKDPICTSQTAYASNTISVTPPKAYILESQADNKKNNPCSTPHTLARFQNLYGCSFKRQSNKEMSLSAETRVETPYVTDVAEPMSEMQAWCREKAFITTTADNPTPNHQSPYYTNISHDSRSLNELQEAPINAEENKENMQTPYFSHNLIETFRESRHRDIDEDCTGKTHSSQYNQALDGYKRRVPMNPASEFGWGVGNKQSMWQNGDCIPTNQAYQAGGQSRTADISVKVRETEYSISFDSQESI